jgi:predicted DNA-binding protein with PD1-like motif
VHLVEQKGIARGIVRAEPGEDLVESLQAIAQAAGWREAFVTGAGVFDLVELAIGDSEVVTLERAELVSLAGRISREAGLAVVDLRASLLAGGRLVSGRIVAAMTGQVILTVDAITGEPAQAHPQAAPQRIERSPAPPMASASLTSASPPTPRMGGPADGERSATKPLSQSFTTRPVVPRIALPADDPDNPAVDPGDYLDHPQLGLCEVVGDDNAGGTRIRVPSGRVRVLRLDALRVLPSDVDAEGRTVYKIAGPRRRA